LQRENLARLHGQNIYQSSRRCRHYVRPTLQISNLIRDAGSSINSRRPENKNKKNKLVDWFSSKHTRFAISQTINKQRTEYSKRTQLANIGLLLER
jgi:hypothetical protein